MRRIAVSLALCLMLPALAGAQDGVHATVSGVGTGWANNSVNAVIFRKNALTTYKDIQFIAYYDQDQYVVVGKRKLGDAKWQLNRTAFKGNASDAHNCISIIADGRGYLHLSWDHHNNPLHYARSVSPGSLELIAGLSMTGRNETRVSYPEFYRLKSGNLLFMYRNGESGQGNLVVNRYAVKSGKWEQLHSNLIDGEGERNAYCQTVVDRNGVIHLSWVWRESPDVASNHDLAYARSADEGLTWERSDGIRYTLPVREADAEYAFRIPQNSELINQTSMAADEDGNPFIATYWRDAGSTIPQYRLVYRQGLQWAVRALDFHKTPFSLKGGGTKRIPISRPQLVVTGSGKKTYAYLIFRDEERGSRPSIAGGYIHRDTDFAVRDLTGDNLESWEPTLDIDLWNSKGILSLFLQKVEQVDGEGKANVPPSEVKVLAWKPKRLRPGR
jgi:hypothetical protein